LRKQAGKRHLNSSKSGRRKQRLRQTVAETGKVARKIIIALGEA
jgi:ribosomal protein L35